MRLDLLLRTAPEGGTVRLMDYFSKEPVVLAEFLSEGPAKRSGKFEATPLKVMPFEKIDVATAERIPFDSRQLRPAQRSPPRARIPAYRSVRCVWPAGRSGRSTNRCGPE